MHFIIDLVSSIVMLRSLLSFVTEHHTFVFYESVSSRRSVLKIVSHVDEGSCELLLTS